MNIFHKNKNIILLLLLSMLAGSMLYKIHKKNNARTTLQDALSYIETTIENAKPIKVSNLKGGFSHIATLAKADFFEKSYVIRVIDRKNKAERETEISAQQIASDYHYGPFVYATKIERGWIILEFLHLIPSSFTTEEQLSNLATLLKKMHSSPPFKSHTLIVDRLLQELHENKEKISFMNNIDQTRLERLVQTAKNSYPQDLKPTHCDLNPNNIVSTNRGFLFIDFEDAGQDDPTFDVATIALAQCANHKEEMFFLQKYYGELLHKPSVLEHYYTTKKIVLLFSGLQLIKDISSQTIETITKAIPYEELIAQTFKKKHPFLIEKDVNKLALAMQMFDFAQNNNKNSHHFKGLHKAVTSLRYATAKQNQ